MGGGDGGEILNTNNHNCKLILISAGSISNSRSDLVWMFYIFDIDMMSYDNSIFNISVSILVFQYKV